MCLWTCCSVTSPFLNGGNQIYTHGRLHYSIADESHRCLVQWQPMCSPSESNLPLEVHYCIARAFFSMYVPWVIPHRHYGQLGFRNAFPSLLFATSGAWNFWHWSQQHDLVFGTIEFHCVSIITHFKAVFCYLWRLCGAYTLEYKVVPRVFHTTGVMCSD